MSLNYCYNLVVGVTEVPGLDWPCAGRRPGGVVQVPGRRREEEGMAAEGEGEWGEEEEARAGTPFKTSFVGPSSPFPAVPTHIHTHTHTNTYTDTNTHTDMNAHTQENTQTQTHRREHTHRHEHTHTHTHTHTHCSLTLASITAGMSLLCHDQVQRTTEFGNFRLKDFKEGTSFRQEADWCLSHIS